MTMAERDAAMEYSFWQRLHGHLKTVRMHRKIVRKLCFQCGLYHQGLTHDLSKYSPAELIPSIRYYQGYRSPYTREKELFGYSQGWLHHKGRNRHHWEYWYDMINGQWQPLKMPYQYLCEMVCDRVAACRTYQKEKYTQRSPLEYYLSRKDKFYMHPETSAELEKILRRIASDGEEKTFAAIRTSLKNHQQL